MSHLHDGRTPEEEGVHSGYETQLLETKRREVLAGLDRRLRNASPRDRITGHRIAGAEVMELMVRTVDRLPVEDVLDAWVETEGDRDALWEELGRKTLDCLADGIRTLAMLWSSAWKEADAPAPPAAALDQGQLLAICTDDGFAPSLYLTELRAANVW